MTLKYLWTIYSSRKWCRNQSFYMPIINYRFYSIYNLIILLIHSRHMASKTTTHAGVKSYHVMHGQAWSKLSTKQVLTCLGLAAVTEAPFLYQYLNNSLYHGREYRKQVIVILVLQILHSNGWLHALGDMRLIRELGDPVVIGLKKKMFC